MITKTGVYKIRNDFKKFKDIYDQNWAFMKLKEKVPIYIQHIAGMQWSEWTHCMGRNVLSLEIQHNFINRQTHPQNYGAVNQLIQFIDS